VNAPTDFHLQSSSPARGAGLRGVDMGAYPVSTPTPQVPTPTNVRIVSP
jgi:hypothetical protein